jgi:putative transposase
MARMPRLVVPGYPHHVTQRGNRRMKTFFTPDDYQAYLNLLATSKSEMGVDIWSYCLMPNPVHMVVVPETENSLSRLFSVVHRQYTRRINFREQWKGHLWQERFHSFVMDEAYLMVTVRYTELNPVRARLCTLPQDWRWSSARAHIRVVDDSVVSVRPMLDRVDNWQAYLGIEEAGITPDSIRQHSGTGRPADADPFIDGLEQLTGKVLKKGRPGPKPGIK